MEEIVFFCGCKNKMLLRPKKDAPISVTDRSIHFIISSVLRSVPFLQIACSKDGKYDKLKKEESSCSVEYLMPGL